MLLRARKDLSFVTRGPVTLPRPALATANSTFNGIYLRPNSKNDGSVPSRAPYSTSPDIWPAGTTPIASYQTTLATAASYASSSSSNIYSGQSNIIYVRGRNGATANKTVNVTLYWAFSGVINSPSQWQNNVIKSDANQSQGTISSLTPNAIGVCDATFLWMGPPRPKGSNHYCLFAQFNDANNSNPFPDVATPLRMSALIQNNLGWGWRNMSTIKAEATWQESEPLTIPSNYPSTEAYSICIEPVGFVGWQAEFYASRTDSRGNPIRLNKTPVTLDKQLLGVSQVILEPGFNCEMTVNMYAPSSKMKLVPGATVVMSCNYIAPQSQLTEAIALGLVDWRFMAQLRKSLPELGVTPTAWTPQGSYSWTVPT
ncbi:MAG: hypothetical protein QOJ16_2244 [Acidobacteriota bacterium]|jgi:hypothetical protein|nr:hypothetical protein [Acidobacteriota bacterium]